MQVCTSLQTDNHTSTPPLSFYRPDTLPAAQPTASKHWRQQYWTTLVKIKNWQLWIKQHESPIAQCNLAKSTYGPSICKLSLQQDLKLTVTMHINYWQLMRGHLITGCGSKIIFFCRYWVWAAISFKLYAIQQQWLHAYNYGTHPSFGYAWLMHIISAVAELLVTSLPWWSVMSVRLSGTHGKMLLHLGKWSERQQTYTRQWSGGHASKLCWGSRSNSKVTWYGLLRVFTKNATPTMNLCSPNTHTMVCKPHKFVNPVNF